MPRYPPIEPYDAGTLTTTDGQSLYWETCGNPRGHPALHLHGGPGSGSTAGARRYFDPERYRIVLFDQRGCGRSRPLASDPDVDLGRTQTTQLLLDDIERLRELLAIPSWVVRGGSWGTTLALAYARAHPQRVDALVLAAVTTTTAREVRWITEDMRRIFPAAWDRFAGAVPAHLRGTPLVDAYATLLADPDPEVPRRR
ncbi:alpha/beta fold hydrolase [Pseudonocardia sp. ICBG1293]|uniref:alpha/beta fold hydrolase n=1 Tax=Pseudonocardia sp. ICBG1293 TaxID=2844382 RepID=UPI001CCFCFEA|nr:alpha/beta fold hydrolase [Pseudonocardia sp. ICBG1293]